VRGTLVCAVRRSKGDHDNSTAAICEWHVRGLSWAHLAKLVWGHIRANYPTSTFRG
jgi:hypothetical protein